MRRIGWLVALVALCSAGLIAQDIFEAVRRDDRVRVKTLLTRDPTLVKAKDANGMTPLHWATQGNHLDMMADLIEGGSDVNARDDFGNAVLVYANLPAAGLLIDKGADVNRPNADGRTLWDRVTNIRRMYYSREWIDLLLSKGVPLPGERDRLRSMLHSAAFHGHRQFIDLLLKKGADISTLNGDGGTFLHSAAAGGLVDMARLALSKGIEVKARDRYGLTALHLAALMGQVNVSTLLVDSGADVEAASLEGKTPLHLAAESKQEAVVALLNGRGASQAPPPFPDLRGKYFGQKEPGMIPELFGLGIVSSHRYEHTSLALSPDGQELFWTSEALNSALDETTGGLLTTNQEGGRWTEPRLAPFETRKHWKGNPAFSPEGHELFFTSDRTMRNAEGPGSNHIWVAEKKDGKWTAARMLPPPVNSESWEEGPSMSRSGTLYFSSARPGGKGARDIYRARFDGGRFLEAENLGETINTAGYESFPYIAPDESYLLFEAIRPGGFGRSDIYISFRKEDGTWTEPKNLGPIINQKGEDRFPSVSPDGRYLFYASDKNGNMDIYWVEAGFIETLRSKDPK